MPVVRRVNLSGTLAVLRLAQPMDSVDYPLSPLDLPAAAWTAPDTVVLVLFCLLIAASFVAVWRGWI